jgi:hypothetical protein
VRLFVTSVKASSQSGLNLGTASAARERVCRKGGSGAARLLSNVGAVAIVTFLGVFTSQTAAAATIINGSATPSSVAPGHTVAIKASFSVVAARTVATYFEIRNSSNVIVADHSYNSQVFSAGQTRTYTWNFAVPSNWPAGTYRVHAGIFEANWSRTLLWVSGITSFKVTTTAPSPSPSPTPAPTPTPSPTGGRQFYVDNVSGSDSNSGTSSSTPWKSLAKLNSTNFQAGDAINFKRGSVWTGTLKVRNSGTSSASIFYRAYGTGAAPQIKNPGVTWGNAIEVTGSYNVIQDFLVSDAHEAGVKIQANAVRNIIWKNEVTRSGAGVRAAGQYNLLTGNYVHDLTMVVNDPEPWSDYGAVCFLLEADNNEVSYNRGINCRAPSYDFGHDGGFVEIWQRGNNSYIHHNYARNTNGFFELGAAGSGSAQNVRVAYNVIVNVTAQGSGVSVCFNTGSYNITVGTFRFENNTFVSTAGHPDAYRIFGCRDDLSALRVRNNIFYSDIQVANNGNFTHSNNVYYMVNMKTGSGVGYGMSTGERSSNPLFMNLGGGDYHLQISSPAVDAGMNLGYTKDFVDVAVPQAVGSLLPDIGAYEFKR